MRALESAAIPCPRVGTFLLGYGFSQSVDNGFSPKLAGTANEAKHSRFRLVTEFVAPASVLSTGMLVRFQLRPSSFRQLTVPRVSV